MNKRKLEERIELLEKTIKKGRSGYVKITLKEE